MRHFETKCFLLIAESDAVAAVVHQMKPTAPPPPPKMNQQKAPPQMQISPPQQQTEQHDDNDDEPSHPVVQADETAPTTPRSTATAVIGVNVMAVLVLAIVGQID